MDQIQSTVWATDAQLRIQLIANGEYPATHFGVSWEVGKSVYQIFKTEDPQHPAIAAHLLALTGQESAQRLTGEFKNMSIRVLPLFDEADPTLVIGCIAILNSAYEVNHLQ